MTIKPNRLVGSREAAERAVAIDPRSVEAQNRLGWALQLIGGRAGAVRQARAVLALDPGFAVAYLLAGQALLFDSRFAEALVLLDSAVQLNPRLTLSFETRARTRLQLGDTAGARSDAAEYDRLSPHKRWFSAYLAAQSGDHAPARQHIAQLPNYYDEGPEVAVILWLALRERERALGVLERDWRRVASPRSLSGPEFAPIADDPRFTAVAAKLRALTFR